MHSTVWELATQYGQAALRVGAMYSAKSARQAKTSALPYAAQLIPTDVHLILELPIAFTDCNCTA